MKTNASNGETIFKKAIKLLNSKCPKKGCVWCELINEK